MITVYYNKSYGWIDLNDTNLKMFFINNILL